MSVQSVSSIVRQVVAVLVTIFGVLTANQTVLHLPAWASSILIAFGPVLLTLEHFLSDPSTGTPAVTTTTTQALPTTSVAATPAPASVTTTTTTPAAAPAVPTPPV